MECTIQTFEDILRACIIDFEMNWDKHLPLVEFAYNNRFYSSSSMAPYEALYGRRCRSTIRWFEVGEPLLLGPDLVYKTLEKVHIIRNQLQMAYRWKKSYRDHRRRDLEFEEGDQAYLKISPIKVVVRLDKQEEVESSLCGSL